MGWPSGQLEERLHVAEVARLLGVSTKTLRRWDRDGTLPAQRDARNGYRFYSRAAVARFAAARERTLGELPRSREALLREASERLARREVVWLTGPPGSGKTWLAQLVARGFRRTVTLRAESPSPHAWDRAWVAEADALVQEPDTLVQIEDVDEIEPLVAWLARRTPRPVLVTTRRASAPNALVVGYLDREERLGYLRERAPDVPAVTLAAVAQRLEGFPPWLDRALAALTSSPEATSVDAAIRAAHDDLEATTPMARALATLPSASRSALAQLSVLSGPFTIDGAAELLDVDVEQARVWIDACVERSLLARRGSELLVYEPVRRVAGAEASASRARIRADRRLLARAHEERHRLAPTEVDELLDAAERAADAREADAFVRAIPPWSVRGPHVARLRALADVEPSPTLQAELAVLEGDLDRASRLAARPVAREAAEHALTAAYVARRRGDHAASRCSSPRTPSTTRSRHATSAVGRTRPRRSTSDAHDCSRSSIREPLSSRRRRRCDQDVLVGDLHVDLRRAPVLWRVLSSVAEAREVGIEPDALLARGWPDERLVRRRAIHRVHGRVRELRALGVPIELVGGRYRLALPPAPTT